MTFSFNPFAAFLSCCFLLPSLSHAQSVSLSAVQTKRLADAGKLWGHIKYFHPWLQYKNINWDSAFAAAVPSIINAPDSATYAAALKQWLGVLNDPATRVVSTAGSTLAVEKKGSLSIDVKDSVLIVAVHNLDGMDDYESIIGALQEIPKLLHQARYLVFDLRPIKPNPWADLDPLIEYSNIETNLSQGIMYKPSVRTVVHDGFTPERGNTSGNYKTFFRVDQLTVLTGTQKNAIPIAFLLNANIQLPSIAVALQDAGKAIVVSEGPLNQSFSGLTAQYTIADGITISMRTGELVRQNGKTSLTSDVILEKENDLLVNLTKTISLLKAGIPAPSTNTESLSVISTPKKGVFSSDKIYPDLGNRILAASKIFTVINTFYVNKKLMDKKWDEVFIEYLPRFAAAKDSMEYIKAVSEMYAHIQDGHGFISSRVHATDHIIGKGITPSVYGKVIEGKFVITALIVDSVAKKEGLAVGDIIQKIDGKDMLALIDEQRPFMPASNYVTQTRYISDFTLCGNDSSKATLTILDKFNKVKNVVVTRRRAYNAPYWKKKRAENEGPIFKLLPNNIGYVDMERLPGNMVDSMLETFKNTKGFIMDMRGYPQGTAWTLAPRLSKDKVQAGALFSRLQPGAPDISAEGNEISSTTTTVTFLQKLPATLKWRYTGKTVMLMNETTQSQAEHSGLFYKAANGTTFIGSQTAGANGDVTNFFIPGLVNLTFSGQNVSYPNGQTMQRKGLIPDITVKPTINGIRAGKDEVLDRAVLFLNTGK